MKKKHRSKTSPIILMVIAVLVVIVGVKTVQVYQKLSYAREEEAALTAQLAEQQQENDALRSDLEKANDEEFIKSLARDLLGLAEDGERIFYDVND